MAKKTVKKSVKKSAKKISAKKAVKKNVKKAAPVQEVDTTEQQDSAVEGLPE
jgi:hypothetical protein